MAAAVGEQTTVISSLTGLSPPLDIRSSRSHLNRREVDLNGDISTMSKAGSNGEAVNGRLYDSQRENLTASEWNGGEGSRAESKSPIEMTMESSSPEQVLRMEYLHQVCRSLLLIVRHRSQNITVEH